MAWCFLSSNSSSQKACQGIVHKLQNQAKGGWGWRESFKIVMPIMWDTIHCMPAVFLLLRILCTCDLQFIARGSLLAVQSWLNGSSVVYPEAVLLPSGSPTLEWIMSYLHSFLPDPVAKEIRSAAQSSSVF